MNIILPFITLFPLAGFFITAMLGGKKETRIFYLSLLTIGLHFLAFAVISILWLTQTENILFYRGVTFYEFGQFTFGIDFMLDKLTVCYGLVAGFISTCVIIFSRTYIHRDPGYKRFFNTVLFFYAGLSLILFSGNFETLCIGWEMIGVSSFLLISFYRERYLPVKNAIKVVSLYRIADIALIIGIWMCHSVFHGNIDFNELNTGGAIIANHFSHPVTVLIIPFIFLIAAAIKSAQLPFSSWVPRAMEGPTTSSAIFYGSIAAHIGLFLIIRLTPLWIDNEIFRWTLVIMGISSSLVATSIARVQSTVKTQIAYSSVAQIGLMFVEIGLGFPTLAIIHLILHAALRSYQLLISPSVAGYSIHEEFFHFDPSKKSMEYSFPRKIKNTLFMLGVKEWNMDSILKSFYWWPLKKAGRLFNFLSAQSFLLLFLTFLSVAAAITLFKDRLFTEESLIAIPYVFLGLGLIMALRSYTEKKHVLLPWLFIVLSHFWIFLSLLTMQDLSLNQIAIYLSGVIVFGILGIWSLRNLEFHERDVNLVKFHGHIYEHSGTGFLFFISCLGISGFPISPTFIGIDFVFSRIESNHPVLAVLTALIYIVVFLAAIRMYAKLFLGIHTKPYHVISYKSA